RAAYDGRPVHSEKPAWLGEIQDWILGQRSRESSRSRSLRGSTHRVTTEPDYLLALRRALDQLDQRPGDADARRLAALSLSQFDYATEAEPYYALARLRERLSVEDLHIRAMGLSRGNLRERAVAAYKEILELVPDDPEALQKLAAIDYSLSQYQEALALAQRL